MGNTNEVYSDRQGHPYGREDLIDFRCSDSFASHYFDEGYSPYRPPQTQTHQTSAADNKLKRKVDSLATEVAGLHNIVHFLIKEVRAWKNTSVRKAQSPTRKTPPSSVGIGITEKELSHVESHS